MCGREGELATYVHLSDLATGESRNVLHAYLMVLVRRAGCSGTSGVVKVKIDLAPLRSSLSGSRWA